MFRLFKDWGKYKYHPEAVIISCFFNPQNSPYRIKAFNIFYDKIKHLNHRIIECIIGDSDPQLPENENIKRVYTDTLLWHKESLLNNIISELPKEYKYIFWVDADLIFTNPKWLYSGAKFLKNCNILQPFEYCIHLERDEIKPSFDITKAKSEVFNIRDKSSIRLWRSFSANYETTKLSNSRNYDIHGHVGFAWAAKREILEKVPLYDKALVGGADHIMAHAAAGHIPNFCIQRSFTDDINDINEWSKEFFNETKGQIGFVEGDIYHIWHGDLDKRNYLKRIVDFTKKSKGLQKKDSNGLFIANEECESYTKQYFKEREVSN